MAVVATVQTLHGREGPRVASGSSANLEPMTTRITNVSFTSEAQAEARLPTWRTLMSNRGNQPAVVL